MKANNRNGHSAGAKRTKNKPANGTTKAGKLPTFRSRVTAGLDLLPSIDGRSTWARIMRDTYSAMLAHAGGADYVPETKRLLARRIAAFEAELIFLEDNFAAARAEGGQPNLANLHVYQRMVSAQRRCLEAIGWERTARDVTTPTLDQYLRMKREADTEEIEELEP